MRVVDSNESLLNTKNINVDLFQLKVPLKFHCISSTQFCMGDTRFHIKGSDNCNFHIDSN